MRAFRLVLLLMLVVGLGEARAETSGIVVMTYNIHHGADASEKDTLDEIGRFIQAQNPDFVGLQEVDQGCRRSGNVMQMERLVEITGLHQAFAPHFEYQGGHYGNGLLSRYPLSGIRNHRLTVLKPDGTSDTRSLLAATATLRDGTTLTVATAHFALDHPSRMIQTSETVALLEPDKQRVIFVGDLNCEPKAPEIATLKESGLQDPDPKDQPTFPAPAGTKKIDYIFTSASTGFSPDRISIPEVGLSDHLPVIAHFR